MKVYYSIRNGGDGSANIKWVESAELAAWDQDHMYEGWGEDCSGDIEFTGEPLFEITTKEKELLEKWFNESDDFKEFRKEFFDEIPDFEVKILDKKYYGVYLEDKLIYKAFQYPGNTDEKGLEKTKLFIEDLKKEENE